MMHSASLQRFALALGWLGVIPFVSLALACLLLPGLAARHAALSALILYGALILSFLGGATWGLTLARPDRAELGVRDLLIGIGASLLGFAGALLTPGAGLPVLVAGFALMLAYDLRAIAAGLLPVWYRPLRMGLTFTAIASLGVAGLIMT